MKSRVPALLCILALLLTACASPLEAPTDAFTETEIIADGTGLTGYVRNGVTFVSGSDLSEVLPNFHLTKDLTGGVTVYSRTNQLKLPSTASVEAAGADRALRLKNDVLLPIDALEALPSLKILRDGQTVYLSHGLDHSDIRPGVTIPVLMYHCISDNVWGYESLFVSPGDFREQMQYLLDHGYTPILFSDLDHLEDFEKPVLITVDDGYKDNYTDMLPILRELNIPVSVFMIASFIGNEYYVNEEQMREMCDSGLVEFQSHTYEHLHLSDHGPEEQEQTMIQSQLAIARATGRVPYVISYPQGMFDQNTETLAAKYYSLGCRTQNALWVTDDGYYHVNRLTVKHGISIEEFAALLG